LTPNTFGTVVYSEGKDQTICTVPDGSCENENANSRDNARLIAAAPDLLAACQEAVGFLTSPAFEAEHPYCSLMGDAAWSKIVSLRAAIAKAEGGEHNAELA